MPDHNFAIDLDDATWQAIHKRAEVEGKTVEQVVAGLIRSYGRDKQVGRIITYTVEPGDSLARIARKVYGDSYKYPLLQGANNLTDPGKIWVGQVLIVPFAAEPEPAAPPAPAPVTPPASPPVVSPPAPKPEPEPAGPPVDTVDPCAPLPGESYGSLPIVGSPTDRPAAQHGDLNLSLRGFAPVQAQLGLIEMGGPTDARAPQLRGLFGDKRQPAFPAVYRVNHWDWPTNSRGKPITDYQVTLVGLQVTPGEPVRVPGAGYDIGQGYQVLVLYADSERITLKYTGEDSIVNGYALHLEGICPEPSLLRLYQTLNNEGRRHLPALRAGQAVGRARRSEIQAAIRDTGRFMDPRVRKDWWRG